MNLQSTDFELFGLHPQFAQDRSAIDSAWKTLQGQAHPDKFAAQGAAAQRLAMQWSVRINEAYQRLRDPIKRGAYLCELAGCAINAHTNTAMPAEFLLQQIQWREELEDAQGLRLQAPAKALDLLDNLSAQVQKVRGLLLSQCEQAMDQTHDFVLAAAAVRSLMFIDKFHADVRVQQDGIELT